MIQEKSCGAVVYKKENNTIYILIERMKMGHYALPKGHMENDETEEDTAIREIKEETNLDVVVEPGFREITSYSPYEGCIKEVVYFVACAVSDDLIYQESELQDIMWLPIKEALKILTYQSDQGILLKAIEYLKCSGG